MAVSLQNISLKRKCFDLKPDHSKLAELGISKSTAAEFGAGVVTGGKYQGEIFVPLRCELGDFIAWCRLSGDISNSRVKLSPALSLRNYIFGLDQLFLFTPIVLVKTPLEVLQCYEAGKKNCVSFLTQTISADQLDGLSQLIVASDSGKLLKINWAR